jgi:hypothetical protein
VKQGQLSNAKDLHEHGVGSVKKINNEAVNYTGNADADDSAFFDFSLIFVTTNRLGLSVIYVLFSLYSNKNIRYLLQTYYNICKNTIYMYAGLLLVVCFLAILIYSFGFSVTSCDAPRA